MWLLWALLLLQEVVTLKEESKSHGEHWSIDEGKTGLQPTDKDSAIVGKPARFCVFFAFFCVWSADTRQCFQAHKEKRTMAFREILSRIHAAFDCREIFPAAQWRFPPWKLESVRSAHLEIWRREKKSLFFCFTSLSGLTRFMIRSGKENNNKTTNKAISDSLPKFSRVLSSLSGCELLLNTVRERLREFKSNNAMREQNGETFSNVRQRKRLTDIVSLWVGASSPVSHRGLH